MSLLVPALVAIFLFLVFLPTILILLNHSSSRQKTDPRLDAQVISDLLLELAIAEECVTRTEEAYADWPNEITEDAHLQAVAALQHLREELGLGDAKSL